MTFSPHTRSEFPNFEIAIDEFVREVQWPTGLADIDQLLLRFHLGGALNAGDSSPRRAKLSHA